MKRDTRDFIIVLVASSLITLGEELWFRFIPKYMEALGAAAIYVGVYDGAKTLLGAIYAYPGGIVADRSGYRGAFLIFTITAIIGQLLMLIVPGWGVIFPAMFLFLGWQCFSLPATFTAVKETLGKSSLAFGVGMQSLTKRLPIIIGPIIGGLAIDHFGIVAGVKVALGASVVLAFLGLITFKTELVPSAKRNQEKVSLRTSYREFDPALRWLLLSDLFIRFCERLPAAWVVIYAMDHVGVSGVEFGYLTAIEMITAMLCYILFSRLPDRHGHRIFIAATFFFFALFPISLLFAESYPLLIAAFAIRGLKEFGEPARKAMIIELSSATRAPGQTIGTSYLIRDLVVSSGSIVGALLWGISPAANLLTSSLFGVVGFIVFMQERRQA